MSSTLSADAKDALAREIPEHEHCRAALRDALALYGRSGIGFRTRRLAVARLFRSLHADPTDASILKVPGKRLGRLPDYVIACEVAAPRRPSARCDRRMELRAAFLAAGSLAAPVHGYHLEFIAPTPEHGRRLRAVLESEGHQPKQNVRRGKTVLYFKDIEAIVALLTSIGAYSAVLQLEDVRALKETKNRIHRLVNTEAANVDRAAGAAAVQRDAIEELSDRYGLRNLKPPLREVATLRLAHPDETLAELGRRCSPPVGKSTVNGRMSALLRLARGLDAAQPRHKGPRAGLG